MSEKPISPLRQRMLEDMSMRRFVPDTQREYIGAVKRLATFLGRSPDTATPEELRAFQLHLTETGVQPPTINATVTALRFFFKVTRPRPVHDDDARRRRVHPPLPHPRTAQRLPSHPPLRLVRQREPRRDDRASARTPGTGNACSRSRGRNRSGGGAATRPALPVLWRPHVRHRDLRCRLPTSLPADGMEKRYLMRQPATSRTGATNGFPGWSIPGYAAARPNTCPALHSARRASPKRVNATQSNPISQTCGHNNVIPGPRRLPHTHITAIKSP